MAKTLRDHDTTAITTYSEQSIIPLLDRDGVQITDRMRELDEKRLLLAVDLRGYGELSNRLNMDFMGVRYDCCVEAVCPPPKEHIHILGRIEEPKFPSRDEFLP
jgi:hypothetical protein